MKLQLIKQILTVLLITLFYYDGFVIYAQEIYLSSLGFNEVQNAVNNAENNSSVILPEGVADWQDHSLRLNSKSGIKLIGQGSDKTVIKRTKNTRDYLMILECNGNIIELHNIGFQGIYFEENSENTPENLVVNRGVLLRNNCIDFKISHCSFTNFVDTALDIGNEDKPNNDIQKGVVYQNEFIDNYHEYYYTNGYGVVVTNNGSTWDKNIQLGSENAVFIEDNYFSGNRHAVASNNNSKYVFRYNNVEQTKNAQNFAMTDVHGHSDESKTKIGSRSYEIYNNIYDTNIENGFASAAIGIRGGDGVIFNNKIASNKIIKTVNLLLEDESLCRQATNANDTISYGIKKLHIWDNEYNREFETWDVFNDSNTDITFEHGVTSECPIRIKKDEHYFLYELDGYTPFTYPHPLRNTVDSEVPNEEEQTDNEDTTTTIPDEEIINIEEEVTDTTEIPDEEETNEHSEETNDNEVNIAILGEASNIEIAPNPINGNHSKVSLDVSSYGIENMEVKVSDMSGKITYIQNFSNSKNTIEIDCKYFSKGLNFIHIFSRQLTIVKKIIKE